MTTSKKVSNLPNMHFRTWRCAAQQCTTWQSAKKFCQDNGVPYNPIHINKLNPKIGLPPVK